jgi:3D (Asp-Asp-Asp) domain-containing protein
VLLVFSAISYSKNYLQQQDPKTVQPTQQQVQPIQPFSEQPGIQPVITDGKISTITPANLNNAAGSDKALPPVIKEEVALAAEIYTATAYSLPGRTASGKPVSRGLIAADPRILPMGTRVRLDAGSFSGEYVVADTGSAVKGRRIDIWTPTMKEARQFGRRAVKLTVLEFGGRRAKASAVRPRRVNALTIVPLTQSTDKQEK